jgi:hypothetical protein
MELTNLINTAKELNKYFSSEDELFTKINSLTNPELNKLKAEYKPTGKVTPVNLLRYVFINKLILDEKIDKTVFNATKKLLETRNLTSFTFLTADEVNGLLNYKETSKSFFSNWSKTSSILFPLIYSTEASVNVNRELDNAGAYLIKELGLKDVEAHIVGFGGSNNYGADYVWVALYPKLKGSHKKSHQLFFKLNKDGFECGIYSGSNIPEENKQHQISKFSSFNEVIIHLKTLIDIFNSLNIEDYDESTDDVYDYKDMELNQIFYGPPGTGKTYHTVNAAISIVEELSKEEFNKKYNSKTPEENRKDLKKAFKDHLNNSRIQFCTFHQSFSYEDFIEGIKPVLVDSTSKGTQQSSISYEIVPGVFRIISEDAEKFNTSQSNNSAGVISLTDAQYEKANFYKISLGDSQDGDDNIIYEYCKKNNCIALGWGRDGDFTNANNEKEIGKIAESVCSPDEVKSTITFMSAFKLYLKVGDYVVISKGNLKIQAIGKVTGEYNYKKDSTIRYNHFREVEWIATDLNIPCEDFYENQLVQKSIYELNKDKLKRNFFTGITKKNLPTETFVLKRNHVLIIDEINRGNISQIFGELITLIEKDKRKGAKEELATILPYSKKSFSVPSNLFIIGTMNTADRSIEALDTALRRRFRFLEMPPKPHLLDDEFMNEIDLQSLLNIINNRIEVLLSSDHKIGHSYFMYEETNNIEDLKRSFKDKLIPLLQEYFYGDFAKIAMIIGEDFIKSVKGQEKASKFMFQHEAIDDFNSKTVWEFNKEIFNLENTPKFIESVKKIYSKA